METVSTKVNVEQPSGPFKRVSWGAIFAGVVIAFVTMLALSLLGVAIGLGTIDPVEEQNPLAGLGTGAAIWWALSMLAAIFVGGWVAGRLAGVPRKFEAGLHGAVTWALVTLLSVYFVTSSIGRLIGGATRLVAQGASLVGQGAAAAAPEIGHATGGQSQQHRDVLNTVKREAEQLLSQTGDPELQPENLQSEVNQARSNAVATAKQIATNPAQAKQEMNQLIDQLFSQGQEIANSADRESLVNVITARTGKSEAEANAIVDRWMATYKNVEDKAESMVAQAEQKTRKVGEEAASALSKAAFWAFAAIALSGLTGICGGCVGRPKRLVPLSDSDRQNR